MLFRSDPEECARAERFIQTADRRLYIAAHAALRLLLGTTLGCHPTLVGLLHDAAGKPLLRGGSRIEFNHSHSGSIALIAMACEVAVGVDVERVRSVPDLDAIAARYLHPTEQRELSRLSSAERVEGFFRCWTRKEAYLKARGAGLSLPLDQFDVSQIGRAHV